MISVISAVIKLSRVHVDLLSFSKCILGSVSPSQFPPCKVSTELLPARGKGRNSSHGAAEAALVLISTKGFWF